MSGKWQRQQAFYNENRKKMKTKLAVSDSVCLFFAKKTNIFTFSGLRSGLLLYFYISLENQILRPPFCLVIANHYC